MSRGLGQREREIVSRITDVPIPLWGSTRSERVALRRAARALERRGIVDVLVLWNESRDRRGVVCAVKAGAMRADGTSWKKLSVACAPGEATLAEAEGVSIATVQRDLARFAPPHVKVLPTSNK